MRSTARLGSCGRGVLVLIRAPGSHPRGDRRGSGERSGGRSQGTRAGRGGKRRTDVRVQQRYGTIAGAQARAAACAWRPDTLIALNVWVLVIP
jgi:hypothetical protein